jgi:hypothetical protein
MTHKAGELTSELRKRRIEIAVITETKKKGKGSKDLGN